MYWLLLILLAVLTPYLTIFFRALSFGSLAPDLTLALAGSLGVVLPPTHSLLVLTLAGLIEDILQLHPLGTSPVIFLLTAFLARQISLSWLSSQYARSRLFLSLASTMIGFALLFLSGRLVEGMGILEHWVPVRIGAMFLTALLIFFIISMAEKARAKRSLEFL